DRNKRRPAIEGFAADVDRIIDHFHPVLHEEPTHGADNSSNQDDDRQSRAAKADRFSQFLDRKRRIAVNLSITGLIGLARGRDELARTIELGHDAVDLWVWFTFFHMTYRTYRTYASSTSASGRIVRISKIEIIGRKRINRNSNAKKNPIVPMNIAQSHWLGEYMPHDDGRKSRWRLVTTMTKRSSHIPILTNTEINHRNKTFPRIFLNHRNCGVRPLQRISAQN